MTENTKLHEKTVTGKTTMMFEFQNPTRLIFAAGALSRLGEVAHVHGKRALDMQKRTLGKTGLTVSALGLGRVGTWPGR